MSEPNNNKNKTSSHWAVSEEDCENMAERNQWKLLETRKDNCLLYTSPSPRDKRQSRMPSSA